MSTQAKKPRIKVMNKAEWTRRIFRDMPVKSVFSLDKQGMTGGDSQSAATCVKRKRPPLLQRRSFFPCILNEQVLTRVKGKLLEYNIKRDSHNKPAEYDLQIIPGYSSRDARTNQNANYCAQRKP